MLCLQCGSQLALLKKFTDGEFCSADHRTLFYDTQQKLIVERLAESARKLKRHKLVTKRPDPVVAPLSPDPDPIPAAKAEERFPPFAALVPGPVLAALVVRNHPYGIASGFASTPPDLPLIPPIFKQVHAQRQSRLAVPMPTFLAARSWNRRKRIEVKPGSASEAQPVFPKFVNLRRLGSPGVGRPAAVRSNFDETNPLGGESFGKRNRFAAELSGFGGTISQPESRLGFQTGITGVQAPQQWIGLGLPKPSDFQTVSAAGERAEVAPASQNATPAIPNVSVPPLALKGLSAISSLFRMRPRGPVRDSSVAQFCTIKPNPVDTGQAGLGASLSFPLPEIELLGPVVHGRFFRPRPRGPVLSSTIAELERIEPGIEPECGPRSAVTFSIPILGAVESPPLIPSFPGRFFPMRARGPVQDHAVDGSASAGTLDLETFSAAVSRPSYPPVPAGDFAPRFLDRGFRMRPRGAVAAQNLAASEPVIPHSVQSPALHSAKPSLPASIIGEYAPVFVDRGFRARPRGPVQSPGLTQFEPVLSGDPAALPSPPSLGHLPASLIGEYSPKPLRRFYRIGPKAPAWSTSLVTSESIPEGIHEPLLSAPALAGLPRSVVGECSPVRLDRFYRSRPRGPVEVNAIATVERIATGPSADLLSAPATGTLPADLIGECAPNSIVRFFRARPRGPVETRTPAAMEQISTGASVDLISVPATGTLPAYLIGECAPNSIVRFFRARPRGPVETRTTAAMEQISTGASVDLVSAPATGTLPAYLIAECAPNSIVRFFRARPRGPVGAPSNFTYEEIVPGSYAALVSTPLMGTVSPDAIGECAPNPLIRLFRSRPCGPMEAVVPAMQNIAAGSAAGLISKPFSGTLPADTSREFAPNPVARFFRPRPRGPVDGMTLRLMGDAGFAAAMESMPLLAALPASIFGGLAPVQFDKPYKMRPRGPVQASDLVVFHRVSTGEAAILPRAGQVPPLTVLDGRAFEPVFLDRLYRMRSRGPVQCEAALFEALTAGDPAVLAPSAALPSMPAVLMRQARTPSRDRGPRMRPPGPGPNSGIRNFDRLDEGEEDTRVPQASMVALPDGILSDLEIQSGSLQFTLPAAIDSAPAKGAAMMPVVSPVPCESIIHPPLFSAELIVDYRPSLIEIRRAIKETGKPAWIGRIAEFWSGASWDLKWVTVAVPVLLGVLIHSSIARLPVSGHLANVDVAAMASNPLPPMKSAVDARWSGLRNELVGRAAVDFQEDFTRGLRFWTGDANWSNSWTYDIHGGVKPGTLAIYTPSIGMSDYDVEFTGGIESKSLGWVFRAADTRSYYAVKLTTIIPGPMPTVALVRSAVIDGKEGPPTQIPLPFPVSKDQVYRVRMEVSGQFFTVFVQGHVVAFWSDERLRTGGIGFFSAKGEQSRLIAVRVSHQFDALGRLCASLALEDKAAKQSGVSTNESQK